MVSRVLFAGNTDVPALQNFLTRHHLLVFLDLLLPSHNYGNGRIVKLWSSGTAQHLHDFEIRIFFHALVCVSTCVLDDHKMTGKVDADGESTCTAYHIDIAVQKTFLDCQSILRTQTGMMKTNSS
jgi:hypothetical protein